MCGVFGYIGHQGDIGTTIVSALKALEYRGYDSWGLAVATTTGLLVEKDVGRINGHVRRFPVSTLGLGHTRWATHGGVTRANAHPHVDCSRHIAVVHNGIIENHESLRRELIRKGHQFDSETDSEVVAHLIEEQRSLGRSLVEALAEVFQRLAGHNAIVVMDASLGELAAAKKTSPLVVGLGQDSLTIASDAFALQGHANQLIHLEDGQLVLLQAGHAVFLDRKTLHPVEATLVAASDTRAEADLGNHRDFLSKEIAEQPYVLRRMAAEATGEVAPLSAVMRQANRVILTGCGSAGHAALAGVYLLNSVGNLDASFIPASEFLYRVGKLSHDDLVVALSQSGETLDVLVAVDEARRQGARLAAIVNAPHSSLERKVDIHTRLGAGPEQCVLATKSYTAMVAALLLTASELRENLAGGVNDVRRASRALDSLLEPHSRQRIVDIGARLAECEHLFVIGRGLHYPSALEAALKIKEVSYIHAEGFAAGELKHGVIALIEAGTPCLVFAPDDETRTDMISSAHELRSRGGRIIGIGSTHDCVFDEFIQISPAGMANAIVVAVPGQLLGYGAARARGLDPDRPRNLAKSVTVK